MGLALKQGTKLQMLQLAELSETGVMNNKFLHKKLGFAASGDPFDNQRDKMESKGNNNLSRSMYVENLEDIQSYNVNRLSSVPAQSKQMGNITRPTHEFLSLKRRINDKLIQKYSPVKRITINVSPWLDSSLIDAQNSSGKKKSPKKEENTKFNLLLKDLKKPKKAQGVPLKIKKKGRSYGPVDNFPKIPDLNFQVNFNSLHKTIVRELDDQFEMFKQAKRSNFARAEVKYTKKGTKEESFKLSETDLPLNFIIKKVT